MKSFKCWEGASRVSLTLNQEEACVTLVLDAKIHELYEVMRFGGPSGSKLEPLGDAILWMAKQINQKRRQLKQNRSLDDGQFDG